MICPRSHPTLFQSRSHQKKRKIFNQNISSARSIGRFVLITNEYTRNSNFKDNINYQLINRMCNKQSGILIKHP